MFAARRGDYLIGYEAGPIPTWRARRCAVCISYLAKEGYSPMRYKHMSAPKASDGLFHGLPFVASCEEAKNGGWAG